MLAGEASLLAIRDSSGMTPVDRPAVVRDDSGSWQYLGTGIQAVGARDLTLGEVVKPRILGRAGEDPEAVVLALSEIIRDSRLNWALQAGTKLDGYEEPLFLLPLAVWEERASQPVAVWLPEYDGSGVDRCLAAAERRCRFEKKAFDDAARIRMRIILVATRMGKSRREVGEILGLSSARVQQLNEDPPADMTAQVDAFVERASRVVAALDGGRCVRHELGARTSLGADEIDEVLTDMLALGLLDETPEGLGTTDAGVSLGAVDADRTSSSRATRRAGVARDRVGNAHR
jgi:hypothetical protein